MGVGLGLWVCGSVVCGSVGLWVCGSVGLWVCGSVGLWVCGSVGLWVCGSVGLGVWGSGGLGVWGSGGLGVWGSGGLGVWGSGGLGVWGSGSGWVCGCRCGCVCGWVDASGQNRKLDEVPTHVAEIASDEPQTRATKVTWPPAKGHRRAVVAPRDSGMLRPRQQGSRVSAHFCVNGQTHTNACT